MLLADDHLQTAEQLRALLQRHFDVVALVADGRALVRAAAQLSPDVIVADITMPLLDGIVSARVILRGTLGLGSRSLVLDHVHGSDLLESWAGCGGWGYVLKDAAGYELVPAVRGVLEGLRYVSRELGDLDGTGSD